MYRLSDGAWLDSAYWQKVWYNSIGLGDSLFAVLRDSGNELQFVVSTNFGDSWRTGTVLDTMMTLAIDGHTIFAGTRNGIYRSTDTGMTWALVNGNCHNPYSIVTKGSVILTGSQRDVYLSTDYGDSWMAIDDGLPNTAMSTFAIDDSELYGGLSSGGIYRAALPTLSSVSASPHPPAPTPIVCSPDPFSYSSTLYYVLDSYDYVSLTIFDPMGRIVAQPIIGEIERAGAHRAMINARNLLPGIYTARLVAGRTSQVVKFVVAR